MPVPDGHAAYVNALHAGQRPDPPLWVDEWSDAHMVIPAETGAAEPGRYRIDRTPFARAVMRALSPEHPARRVVVKGASQLLKTQVGLNWFCALIVGAPANMIWLQPTDKLSKRVSARFDKTAQSVRRVRERVAAKRSRDNRNTMDTKEFKGGTLWILTGRSASNLSEASARYVYADELDRILRELKGEGDPVELLEKRQSTYGRKAKSYYTSSPTEEEASRIDELFSEGNQQHCYVPCPHCGEMQSLEWDHLHWDLAAGRAWYVCAVHGCVIEEHHKPTMLARHEWRAHAKGDGETESFTISYLYAPLGWDSWLKLAQEYVKAAEEQDKGNAEKMQVFWNTRLARCWAVAASRIRPEQLQAKAEPFPLGIAPLGALMITAAADVQGNRIELQLLGWGPGPTGLEAWTINTHILYGDPTLPDVWRELDSLLVTPIRHAGGAHLIIRAACIDSGDGDSTQEVYEFVRPRKRRYVGGQIQNVLAVKGASQAKKPVIAGKPGKVEYNYRGKPILGAAEVWQIGTDTAKDWLLNRLVLEDKTAIHTSTALPIEFYQQVLAEAKVTRWDRGRKRRRYELIKRGLRNEQLDMLVYNLAAAHYLGLDRYTAERWEQARNKLKQADLLIESLTAPSAETVTGPESASPSPSSAQPQPPPPLPPKPRLAPVPQKRNTGFGSDEWAL